jgi:hypothetical protein
LKRYLWLHEATVANQTLASYSHPVSSSHNRRVAFSSLLPQLAVAFPDATADFIPGSAGPGSAASVLARVSQRRKCTGPAPRNYLSVASRTASLDS